MDEAAPDRSIDHAQFNLHLTADCHSACTSQMLLLKLLLPIDCQYADMPYTIYSQEVRAAPALRVAPEARPEERRRAPPSAAAAR